LKTNDDTEAKECNKQADKIETVIEKLSKQIDVKKAEVGVPNETTPKKKFFHNQK
jgi:hypothetical protein